jgi:predicted alpha/beta superfamily hydrolase
MVKTFQLLAFLCCSIIATAQISTRFEIRSLPPSHASNSPIYIAGSFNGWNPKSDAHKFKQNENGTYYLVLDLAPGKYEYKITRGGWDRVETTKTGSGTGNRTMDLTTTSVVELNIDGWADQFAAAPKKSTASKNVFNISAHHLNGGLRRKVNPQFDQRRIWVYFPPDYTTSLKRYPVLYMHDGQNVFEDSTSFSGEWGVDEFMDSIRNSCIVVAVDNGGSKRMNEYGPYDMERFGKGQGKQYVDFLATTLKPYIDRKFRTLKKKEFTFVAGSSMGGLISMYAILQYPKVFGGAGVFSPSFWIAPKIYEEITAKGEKIKGKIYFYAGKQESESMVSDMLKAFQTMHSVSKADMVTVIRDDGKHNEGTWRREFPGFWEWMIKK